MGVPPKRTCKFSPTTDNKKEKKKSKIDHSSRTLKSRVQQKILRIGWKLVENKICVKYGFFCGKKSYTMSVHKLDIILDKMSHLAALLLQNLSRCRNSEIRFQKSNFDKTAFKKLVFQKYNFPNFHYFLGLCLSEF